MPSDARDLIRAYLASLDLSSEEDWAIEQLIEGRSPEAVQIELETRPAFQVRFPIYQQLKAEGRAMSVNAILAYEEQWRQLMHVAGVPMDAGVNETSYIQQRILGGVSINEASQRVQTEMAKVLEQPPEVLAAYGDYFGPNTREALLMTFLDPDLALPDLERMANAAVFGGTGTQFGFNVGADVAVKAGEVGIGGAQARQGFADLAARRGLLEETISESTDLTAQQGVEATFGLDANAARVLEERRAKREAEFSGAQAGGLLTGAGAVGLGSAESGRR